MFWHYKTLIAAKKLKSKTSITKVRHGYKTSQHSLVQTIILPMTSDH